MYHPHMTIRKLDVEHLRERYDCDAVNGVLISRHSGKPVGTRTPGGYFNTQYRLHGTRHTHLRHRIIWALHHNVSDFGELDHINGVPGDDRIDNLREVSHRANLRNARLWSHNTSGANGVNWERRREKWVAYGYACLPCGKSKRFYLGQFSRKADAIDAKKRFERENGYTDIHGEPRHEEACKEYHFQETATDRAAPASHGSHEPQGR